MTDPINPTSGHRGAGGASKPNKPDPSGFKAHIDKKEDDGSTPKGGMIMNKWGLSKAEVKKFYSNFCNFIVSRIKADEARAKKASANLKASETGKTPSD
ncbi:MAG: hypothetical protein S4CHLAM37_13650 [Chlamydiia bacterium]|nr:hypothetical protein [Chlamydiia bacterium]